MEREPNSSEANLPKPELEQRPEVAASPETSHESEATRQKRVESAREALEQQSEPVVAEKPGPPKSHQPITKIDQDRAYRDTMQSLRRHLGPASKSFSKVIHNPTVENVSEVVGKTVARPSVTLGATTTALIIGSLTYITAKRYGFALSGSELILSLILGGIVGALLEGLSKSLRRRH